MKLQLRAAAQPLGIQCTITTTPARIPAGKPVELAFDILAASARPGEAPARVRHFELVHEKLFHFFAVSQDLEWFLHDHPVLGEDGRFRLPVTLPTTGMYQTFADFYPAQGTPQWIPSFLLTEGADQVKDGPRASMKYTGSQRSADTEVRLILDPLGLKAGKPSELSFDIRPGDGLEPWLGTYAHALWVSHDLLDAAHAHPEVFGSTQFLVYFPKAGGYRFWLQFKRFGTVHTVRFDLSVNEA